MIPITLLPLCFLVTALVQLTHVAAISITGNVPVQVSGAYVTGTTPTQLKVALSFAGGTVSGIGDTITLSFTTDGAGVVALFTASSSPTVTSTGAGTPVFSTSVNGTGSELTLTLASGSIGGETIELTVADNLVALPAAGRVFLEAGAVLQGAASSQSQQVFNIISAPSIILTSSDLNAGTYPSSLQVTYEQPFMLLDGANIVITASQAVFAASATTGLTASKTDSGTVDWSGANYTTNAGGTTFTLTTVGGTNYGSTISMTLGPALLTALPSVAGAVTLSLEADGQDVTGAVTGFGTIVVPGPPSPTPPSPTPPSPTPPPPSFGAVSGDPVTYFRGKKSEFVLPWGVYTPMLVTPHMSVFAWPMPGKDNKEQWVGRILVTSAGGETALYIDIKRDIDSLNRSAIPPDAFETIDVTLPLADESGKVIFKPLAKLPPRDAYFSWQGIHIQLSRIPPKHPAARMVPRREAALVISRSAKELVMSSSAKEWYGENQDATKFAHLDMEVFDMYNASSFGGILPELWGIKPLSTSGSAVLKGISQEYSAV